jgi:hypothetical protein
MTSDTDDVQTAYMVLLEEEVSFAICPYTGPQASWHRYRYFYRRRVSIFLNVLHGSPLILEPLYLSPSMIIRHCLSCQDRSKVGWDARCAWMEPYRLSLKVLER